MILTWVGWIRVTQVVECSLIQARPLIATHMMKRSGLDCFLGQPCLPDTSKPEQKLKMPVFECMSRKKQGKVRRSISAHLRSQKYSPLSPQEAQGKPITMKTVFQVFPFQMAVPGSNPCQTPDRDVPSFSSRKKRYIADSPGSIAHEREKTRESGDSGLRTAFRAGDPPG